MKCSIPIGLCLSIVLTGLLTAGDYPFLYLDTANAVNGDGEVVGYGWQGSPGGHQEFIALPGTP